MTRIRMQNRIWPKPCAIAELRAAYESRTDAERAEDDAELALWDQTLLDGLEDE